MLRTPRLVLRRLTGDDLPAYAALVRRRGSDALHWGQSSSVRCGARLIGRVGLWVWDRTDWTSGHTRHGLGERAEVELGWALMRSAWGYGFATEAAAAMREHAFRQLRLTRLISLIHPRTIDPSASPIDSARSMSKTSTPLAGGQPIFSSMSRPSSRAWSSDTYERWRIEVASASASCVLPSAATTVICAALPPWARS